MEEAKRRRPTHIHQLEDIPDLIQRIQLVLPSRDAARTCILSKSWHHIWSTSPAIRFRPSVFSLFKRQHQRMYMRWIHRTLLRYHRDNIPITSLDLRLGIHTAYRSAQTLIRQATSSQTSLKELHLTILTGGVSFDLPDEIFSCENLNTLRLERVLTSDERHSLDISSNPVIHCTNLRVLELSHVYVNQYVVNKLISKNKLLEKIILELPLGFQEIKVNNLCYLRELEIYLSDDCIDILEIDDVPSLRSLVYVTTTGKWDRPQLFKMCTIGSLRELYLDNVSMDDAFSNMIKSNFPFLEDLTLAIRWCSVEIVDIRCLTLQRVTLKYLLDEEIKVHVNAPNLLTYNHESSAIPSLSFTTIPLEKIELFLTLDIAIDESFFLKMREALKLSSKFNIVINGGYKLGILVPFKIDDVRTMVTFPATNVEEVYFRTRDNKVLCENSLLFDAVFSVCHPMYVKADYKVWLKLGNYLLELIIKGVMEICEIRNPRNGRWETLTSSSLILLDRMAPFGGCEYEFKLSWCFSP